MTSSLAICQYDNVGAYKTLQALMNRGENLTIKFFKSKDNIPCAWIESRNIAGFKYEMKMNPFMVSSITSEMESLQILIIIHQNLLHWKTIWTFK